MADANKVSQTMDLMLTMPWPKWIFNLVMRSNRNGFLLASQMSRCGLVDNWVSNQAGSSFLVMKLGPAPVSSLATRRWMHV